MNCYHNLKRIEESIKELEDALIFWKNDKEVKPLLRWRLNYTKKLLKYSVADHKFNCIAGIHCNGTAMEELSQLRANLINN